MGSNKRTCDLKIGDQVIVVGPLLRLRYGVVRGVDLLFLDGGMYYEVEFHIPYNPSCSNPFTLYIRRDGLLLCPKVLAKNTRHGEE